MLPRRTLGTRPNPPKPFGVPENKLRSDTKCYLGNAFSEHGVFGDTVTYTCVTGYYNATPGNGSRVCNVTGQWLQTSDDPDCQVVSCGTPPVFAGTKASLALGYYGDNLTFTCADDLVHVGGGTGRMTCDVTGVWELDGHDTPPLCLGNFLNFVSSREEEQTAPPQALTSASTRSNLECAAVCARASSCYGYTFNRTSKVCAMNFVSYLPVITDMKKKYA
ncbi:sushi, von Willebrand factor type A, EGF and pentraxin domain-containing protein 1-like [Pomacea canaliculata]|uniref:sushi, von Willebrand factor type A, EGF and pentraxin domain-containing protein 1-like n=1 Tax=Pomacea canaliculata TaxID=400727 RepID=UPI000D72D033|nr:sushi, von Willebrand factor type A, EGF and pentraxin domain-containing protein 1-like [Pomacea canaliculata]XP_025086468.1 sushi, von Willebrand factor type A, EGF and pentraxin domain-containing protein 1-like [Pomacea canaliculata]